MVRYHTGKNSVAPQDQVTHEFAAAYRHYHAAAMSTVIAGKPSEKQLDMQKACVDALASVEDTLRAGNTVGQLYDAHAKAFTDAGYADAMLAACGYTLGISFPPTWMDWPMIWKDHPDVLEPGMVFFMHMILLDGDTGLTISLGETAIVTDGSCEPIKPRTAGVGGELRVEERSAAGWFANCRWIPHILRHGYQSQHPAGRDPCLMEHRISSSSIWRRPAATMAPLPVRRWKRLRLAQYWLRSRALRSGRSFKASFDRSGHRSLRRFAPPSPALLRTWSPMRRSFPMQ